MTDVVSKKLPGLVKCPNRLISLSNRLIFRVGVCVGVGVCVCVWVCVCVQPGSDGRWREWVEGQLFKSLLQ